MPPTLVIGLLNLVCHAQSNIIGAQWEIISTKGISIARHEAGQVAYKDKLLLISGRRGNQELGPSPAGKSTATGQNWAVIKKSE